MPILNQNKRISQFNTNTTPTLGDVLPIVNNGETKKISLSGFTDFLTPYLSATTVEHWLENNTLTLGSSQTVVISGNYVLENTNLTLSNSNKQFSSGSLVFNEYTQIFIGGNLLLVNSNIINNGLISIGGGLILSGSSTITGTGIII